MALSKPLMWPLDCANRHRVLKIQMCTQFVQNIPVCAIQNHLGFRITQDGFLICYTDGSKTDDYMLGDAGGKAVWFGPNHPSNTGLPMEPALLVFCNNNTEIQAMTLGAREARKQGVRCIWIVSDSKTAIDMMSKKIFLLLIDGKDHKISPNLKNDYIELLMEMEFFDQIRFSHVPAHCGQFGNEEADQLAKKGTRQHRRKQRAMLNLPYRTPMQKKASLKNLPHEDSACLLAFTETVSEVNRHILALAPRPPPTKFLQQEDVKGISLCQEKLRVQFPFNWPVSLNRSNMHKLKIDGPFVVAPKPVGIRYLLYVDPNGVMFFENNTQNVFKVDPALAPRLPKDTILDGIVVKKLVRGEGSNGNGDGKLSFVIMDATRVDGVQLTQECIKERISAVEVMIPDEPSEEKVFDLDIAKYVAASQIENYLSQGFKERYEYPLRSFVLHPIEGPYNCSGNGNNEIYQWYERNDEVFSFRLSIAPGEGQSKGDLYVVDSKREEVKFDTKIDLTDELRTMNGCIIECRLVDNRWRLVRVPTHRQHPNELRVISEKLETMKTPVTREMLLASLGVLIEDK